MKKLIFAFAILLGLLACLLAQDGPISVGSDTVAQPRKPAADPSSSNAPPASAAPAPASSSSGDLPKIPSKLTPKKDDGPASANFSADASLVTVDVAVVDNKNNFVPTIQRKYFRILEDNVPQTIREFSMAQAPMTVAIVIEFSKLFQWYRGADWFYTLQTANAFLSTMKRDDYVAIIKYDLRTQIVCDFTNNPGTLQQALHSFTFPDFSEANLFDALTDTADRMSKIEGRKSILVLTSGIDTFSKITFDQTRRKLQDSGVPIYSIGLLQMLNPGGATNINQVQADNEMKTFTKETGGQAFFPRWPSEIGDVFATMQGAMRNQYTLAYAPSNQEKDGKFRKITVQLIDPETNQPIVMKDEKNKPIKYTIIAKQGYKAPHAVE
jgi:VWFA-related protein